MPESTTWQDEARAEGSRPLHSRLRSAAGRDALSGLIADTSNFIERMPFFGFTLQRFAEDCAERLADIAFGPAQMTLSSLASSPSLQDIMAVTPEGVSAVADAPGWEAHLLFSADRNLVSLVTDMFLGADGTQLSPTDDRPISKTETRLMALFFDRTAGALSDAFAPVQNTPFYVGTPALEIDAEPVARPNKPVVAATFQLRVAERTGTFSIVLSHAALAPMRAVLAQIPKEPEERRDDPGWSEHIQSELNKTHVTLTAILDDRMFTLDEICNFRVGQIIQLDATPESRVRVECAGEPMLWCHLGKSNGYYTLRVDDTIDRDQEFMDEITRG